MLACLLLVIFFQPAMTRSEGLLPPNFRSGEFLVKFKNEKKVFRIFIDEIMDVSEVINSLSGKDNIEYIEPNYTFTAAAFPNDPLYPQQWYLQPINARQAWSKSLLIQEQEKISKNSIIAVLDTGVDINNPDLKKITWSNSEEVAGDGIDNDGNGYIDDINGWDFVSEDNNPNPSFDAGFDKDALSHGTIVAGIAAAGGNNNEGVTGVSWLSKIMPLRVLDSNGLGDIYSVIRAIDYAIAKDADVINMSFVGTGFSNSLFNAIKRAYGNDIIMVAAAGNTDPSVNGYDMDLVKAYPACYDGDNGDNMIIGVASVGRDLKKSDFSNYGACVDLVAPGQDFYSTQVYEPNYGFNKYYDGYWSGTSLSTPLVSGAFGLLKALRPNLNFKQIVSSVLNSTKDIDIYNNNYQGKLGSGQLDMAAALDELLSGVKTEVSLTKNSYLVAGLGFDSFPQLKILKADGTVFKSFYAYSPNFTGQINIAVGDVNGDGKQEIVTGTGSGGGPHVRVFNVEGYVLSQFFAQDKNSRGGINIAVGDVNGDGKQEIITGAGKGEKPQVKIFNYQGELMGEFLAYMENFIGGVKVAVGDVNGDGKQEIVTGAGSGGGPHVRIFDINGLVVSQFFAFNKNFGGGVNVAVGDLHGDGRAEIIVSVEQNSTPVVRVFDYQGRELSSFFAYEPTFLNGISVATGDFNKDGINEIITGKSYGGSAEIKIFNLYGTLQLELLAHNQDYIGGVRPGVLIY